MQVTYVNHMGDDLEVVDAARVSFNKRSEWTNRYWMDEAGDPGELKATDEKLIKFLARHNHWTPFAHTAIKLRVSAPIPIRTQCFKHKAGFVENEESRRYISSKPKVFIPKAWRKAAANVKQGSSKETFAKGELLIGDFFPSDYGHQYLDVADAYKEVTDLCVRTYTRMIEGGVCPEQARFVLPQGVEVNWMWTGSLYAYANFYNKRSDEHAQKEIQELAAMVDKIIRPLFPVSWRALVDD